MSSITIDDRDPSIQVDWNRWWKEQNSNAFMGTFSLTDSNGAVAIIPFKGTSIQVFGAMDGGAGSTYSVDGSPPVLYQRDLDQAPFKAYKQLFYTSSDLSDGDHTLVITNVSDDYDLILDSLIIKSAPAPPPPTVISPAKAPAVTTQILTTIASATNVVSAGKATSFITSSDHSIGSSGAPNTSAQSTTIPSLLASVPSSPATSSPSPLPSPSPSPSLSSFSSPASSSLPPPPASESHRNHIPTGAIIGLAVGLIIAVASLLLLAYLCRRRRKRQEYLTRPHPLPHLGSLAHVTMRRPSPASSALDHSHPLLSEKSQLRALETTRDPDGAQVRDLARGNNLPTSERITTYPSSPTTQWEGRDTTAPSHMAIASTSSNTVVAENLVGRSRHKLKVATKSLRMGLLSQQGRTLNNDRSELPPEGTSINAGSAGGSAGGMSSAMGILNSNSLHQRTTSLNVFDGRLEHDGSSGNNERGDGTASAFDEPPPYLATAR